MKYVIEFPIIGWGTAEVDSDLDEDEVMDALYKGEIEVYSKVEETIPLGNIEDAIQAFIDNNYPEKVVLV